MLRNNENLVGDSKQLFKIPLKIQVNKKKQYTLKIKILMSDLEVA